jgi:hypothetical protein
MTLGGVYEESKILQEVLGSRKDLNLVFVDHAKAFDTVVHKSIIRVMRRKRIPGRYFSQIENIYS